MRLHVYRTPESLSVFQQQKLARRYIARLKKSLSIDYELDTSVYATLCTLGARLTLPQHVSVEVFNEELLEAGFRVQQNGPYTHANIERQPARLKRYYRALPELCEQLHSLIFG
jgi:hypothetical protein